MFAININIRNECERRKIEDRFGVVPRQACPEGNFLSFGSIFDFCGTIKFSDTLLSDYARNR